MKLIIPPPVQALICALAMWLLATRLPQFGFSFAFQQKIAILIAGIGILIDLISVGLFTQYKTTVSPFSPDKTNKLVTTGMYRYSRNPMYLGMCIILTGLALWLGNFAAFLMVVVYVWFVTRLQIMPEEEILTAKFGKEYTDYIARVRRWI